MEDVSTSQSSTTASASQVSREEVEQNDPLHSTAMEREVETLETVPTKEEEVETVERENVRGPEMRDFPDVESILEFRRSGRVQEMAASMRPLIGLDLAYFWRLHPKHAVCLFFERYTGETITATNQTEHVYFEYQWHNCGVVACLITTSFFTFNWLPSTCKGNHLFFD